MPALPATSPIWYPLVAALISAGLAFYAWPRRFARGGRPFIGCLSVFSFVFLAQALMRAADVLFLKVLFFQLWVVLAAATTLLGLWLACEYAGITRRMSRVLWFALSFPLAAFSLLALTNSAHRLIWSRFGLRDACSPI